MKKIVTILFVFLFCNMSAVINAKNYTGTLTVYVNGVLQQTSESAVTATEAGGTAKLEVSAFTIAGYSAMKVTMNAEHDTADGKLKTPATVTVNLPMSLVLGKLTVINENLGTLVSDACSLDMQLRVANKPNEEIRIVFSGTAQ